TSLCALTKQLTDRRAQRRDAASLTLRVYRVECERRLARPGQAGEDDELVPRDGQRDVLQVVLARAADGDLVSRHLEDLRLFLFSRHRKRSAGGGDQTAAQTFDPALGDRGPASGVE